ncbi:hypothetical protein OIE43_25950 [Streptomyces pseudovenezuelae]|uniref:hypothetical protein n=1 Tax=Streptomyces pseudovenezuelae TaxID=67350 RepID=UPI002E346B0D|nr:hypothetical protein [Streptomyces pseudovenezuelae]
MTTSGPSRPRSSVPAETENSTKPEELGEVEEGNSTPANALASSGRQSSDPSCIHNDASSACGFSAPQAASRKEIYEAPNPSSELGLCAVHAEPYRTVDDSKLRSELSKIAHTAFVTFGVFTLLVTLGVVVGTLAGVPTQSLTQFFQIAVSTLVPMVTTPLGYYAGTLRIRKKG